MGVGGKGERAVGCACGWVAWDTPISIFPHQGGRGKEEGLTEEVSFGGADEFSNAVIPRSVAAAFQQDRRGPVQLAHDEAGGGGEFVGDGDGGGAKWTALGILHTSIVQDGVDAGDADGDVDGSFPPGPAKGVGDYDGDIDPVSLP